MEKSNNVNELNIDLTLLLKYISRDDLLKLMGTMTNFLGICTKYLADTEMTGEQYVQNVGISSNEQVAALRHEPAKEEAAKKVVAQAEMPKRRERRKTKKWKNDKEHKAYVKETLAPYFTEEFRSEGQESGISKYDMLINHLVQPRPSLMDEAKIAMVLYNNKGKILTANAPDAFSAWYRILCNALDWKYVDDYRPHKIRSIKKIEKEFNFLFNGEE